MIISVDFAMSMYRKLHREACTLLRLITYVVRVRGDLYIGEFGLKRKYKMKKKKIKRQKRLSLSLSRPRIDIIFRSVVLFRKSSFREKMMVIYKIGR